MDAHADYYEPILRAERAMAADLEAFQAEEAASHSAASASASAEGQKEAAATEAAAPPSSEGQNKQVAEAAVLEESRGPAAWLGEEAAASSNFFVRDLRIWIPFLHSSIN